MQHCGVRVQKFTVLIELERLDWQNCNSPVQVRVGRCGRPRVKYEEETFSMNKANGSGGRRRADAPGLAVAQTPATRK
jgi:hypothetical protein